MTDISLREHFEALRKADKEADDERDKRYSQQFVATEKALDVAREALAEYKKASNEWRDAMKDREAKYITKETIWGYIVGLFGMIMAVLMYFK